MGVEILDSGGESMGMDDTQWAFQSEPLNGSDARRRLAERLEEQRLFRDIQDFDFDYNFDDE